MEYGIYISAAGALAQDSRLDVIANNMANVDTPGFKRSYTIFQHRLTEAMEPPRYEPSQSAVLDRIAGGVFVQEVARDPQNGALENTGNDLDVGLIGDGWFTVEVNGEQLYTRAGNFARGFDGTLLTQDGQGKILDTEGKPIHLPGGVRTLIDEQGTVFLDGEPVARLWIQGRVTHEYTPLGNNRFRFDGEGDPQASSAAVRQQFLERSNVSPVREMVALIKTFRAYEANQRLITQQDETFGRAVNDVGRVS